MIGHFAMRFEMMLFLMSLMLTRSAFAAEIDITEGQLAHTGSFANRVVAAKNNTGPIATLWVECGFFRGTELLAAGTGYAENIEARQTVYVNLLANYAENADRTECRVSNIIR
jgi:hypothetical protein